VTAAGAGGRGVSSGHDSSTISRNSQGSSSSSSSGSSGAQVSRLLELVGTGRYEPHGLAARRSSAAGTAIAAAAGVRAASGSSNDDSKNEEVRARVLRQRAGSRRSGVAAPRIRNPGAHTSLAAGARRAAASSSDSESNIFITGGRQHARPLQRSSLPAVRRQQLLHRASLGVPAGATPPRQHASVLRASMRRLSSAALASRARSAQNGEAGSSTASAASSTISQHEASRPTWQRSRPGGVSRAADLGRRASSTRSRPAPPVARIQNSSAARKPPVLLSAPTCAAHMRGALQQLCARRRKAAAAAQPQGTAAGGQQTSGRIYSSGASGISTGSDSSSDDQAASGRGGRNQRSAHMAAGSRRRVAPQLHPPIAGMRDEMSARSPPSRSLHETYETVFRRLSSSGCGCGLLPAGLPADAQGTATGAPGGTHTGGPPLEQQQWRRRHHQHQAGPACAARTGRPAGEAQPCLGLGSCSRANSSGSGFSRSSSDGRSRRSDGDGEGQDSSALAVPMAGFRRRAEHEASAWAHSIIRRLSASGGVGRAGLVSRALTRAPVAAGAPFGFGSAGTYRVSAAGSGVGGGGGGRCSGRGRGCQSTMSSDSFACSMVAGGGRPSSVRSSGEA
jgi:hypothetical protein